MVVVFGAGYVLWTGKAGPDINLPTMVITGVVVLLFVLALVVIVFYQLNLTSEKEALGLPDGSVRALIALILILLFAIITTFLYDSLSKGGPVQSASDLTAQERQTLLARVPPQRIILDQQLTPPDAKDAKFKILYRDAPSPVSEDFAKQLLVLLGTLITSVASFYFGTNAVASAQVATVSALKGGTGDMNVTGVSPPTIPPTSGQYEIAINGSNLWKVNDVTFRQGKETIVAEIKKVEDNKVTCSVSLKGTELTGKWDVIVSDGTNLKKLPDGLEIKASGS
jgi:hypothetical protein